MYSDADLDAAVSAGILPPDNVLALRRYMEAQRAASMVDEEHFRLVTGFNDIFVAIAGVILLVATAWIGSTIALFKGDLESPLGGLLTAIAAWGLAEYFTRQRRMALPSIIFLLAFAGGVAATFAAFFAYLVPQPGERVGSLLASVIAIGTALAVWGHWKRFGVPITIAALTAALVATAAALLMAAFPMLMEQRRMYLPLLGLGIAVFLFAMRWDMSDRERRTRRADVAFWLHLLAAPLIAHSLFNLLNVFDGDMAGGKATIVIALYFLVGLVALAVDRRALLVSSLAYVLYALYALFRHAGAIELGAAFTALVIGSALLLLSAFWHSARRLVVSGLPEKLGARLPTLDGVMRPVQAVTAE